MNGLNLFSTYKVTSEQNEWPCLIWSTLYYSELYIKQDYLLFHSQSKVTHPHAFNQYIKL